MFNASALKANQEGIYIGIERLSSCVRNLSYISVKTKLFYKQLGTLFYKFSKRLFLYYPLQLG